MTLAMILTCILEIYLRFKGRKGWKFNHFRFWKIKKWERQDKGIKRLGDEQWPLWSKKEGKKTWEMRLEARFIKLYGNLELKIWWQHVFWFWGQILSTLKSPFWAYYMLFWSSEVKNPTLQTVYKSELKWRSYDHLNTTTQSWRVISKWFWNPTYEFEIQF